MSKKSIKYSKEPADSEQDEKRELVALIEQDAKLDQDYKDFLKYKSNRVKNNTLLQLYRKIRKFPASSGLKASYFEKRLSKISPVTVRLELTYAKDFLKWAECEPQLNELKGFNVGKIKRTTIEKNDLYTPEELEAIFAAAEPDRDRPMLLVLWETATRASELLSMTCEGVRPGKGNTLILTVHKSKTKKRDLPIRLSVSALSRWLEMHPTRTGSLWVSKRQVKGRYEPLTRTGLDLLVRRTLHKAGIEGKKHVVHLFRHTRLTEQRKKGMRDIELERFAGWEGSSMLHVYAHLDDSDMLDKWYELEGITETAERQRPQITERVCEKCGTKNDPSAGWCIMCHTALTPELREFQQQAEAEKQVSELRDRMMNLEEMIREMQKMLRAVDEEGLIDGLKLRTLLEPIDKKQATKKEVD